MKRLKNHSLFKPVISFLLIITMLCLSGNSVRGLSSDGLYWSQDIDILSNPGNYSYEGHHIVLRDISNYMFGYNGLGYLPVEVAESGYVATRWEGDFRILKINEEINGSVIAMNVCYDVPGVKELTLTSKWLKGGEAGNSYSDSHIINIKACPAIDCYSFGGEQRAFQRQELNVRLAQNPNYPIDPDTLSIVIRDRSGLVVPFCNPLEIKTDAAAEFIDLKLEFVTKNNKTDVFTYTVLAKDSRGRSLNETHEFTVKEDLPPQAMIKMPLRVYRDSNKTAIITARYNGIKSDDDVILRWSLPDEATDISFSDDNKELSFTLHKPGICQISLNVTDIWKDTIDKFTYSDPRKSASYTGKLTVDNLAPFLGEDDKIKTFDLLLINSEDANLEEMSEAMMEYNVNLNIHQTTIDKTQPVGEVSYLGQINLYARYDLDETVYYESAQLLDDNYYYRLAALSTKLDISESLYIYKYDLQDLNAEPQQIRIPSDAFSGMSRSSKVSLSSDLQGKNLYLTVDDETLIMDIQSCSFYPKLALPLRNTNIAFDETVYALCDDGFYLIDLKSGGASLISDYKAVSSCNQSCRLIFGQAYFCAEKDGAVYQCIMDLNSKQIKTSKLFEGSGIHYLLGISPAGKMYFETNDFFSSTVRSFTRNCDPLYQPLTLDRQSVFMGEHSDSPMAHPVFDANGEINYIYTGDNYANFAYFPTIYVWHLNSQSLTPIYCDLCKPDLSKALMGLQLGDGTLVLGLGTKYDFTCMKNSAVLMQLDPAGSYTVSSLPFDSQSEYQCKSNEYIAISNTFDDVNTIHFYKFTEGYQAKSTRTSLESLSADADYKEMTDSFDLEAILQRHKITKPGISDVSIYRRVGDVVTLEDFGFSKDNYTDYEQDLPLRENSTMSFPFTCTEKGRYVFYFSVTDTTGTAYDRESKKQMGIIYVDSDEEDYKDDPIQKPGDKPGRMYFILHRKY